MKKLGQVAKDQIYISKKVEHMLRKGLVTNIGTRGQHGGAAPDWLIEYQNERLEAEAKKKYKSLFKMPFSW